jgi:hypothetical protein
MFLRKHVQPQIYIVIMCSIVLRNQVVETDNLKKKKKEKYW